MISKEKLSDLKEKYEKAEKLVEEESKLNSPTNPFKSHYAAKNILVELQNNLKNLIGDHNNISENEEVLLYIYILGFIYKDTGRICVWTEELTNGETYLQQCIDLLEPYKLHPECINAYLGALNQIGILWSNRQDAIKSKEYLQQAEDLYFQFIALNQDPLTIYDIFGTKDEVEAGKGLEVLEKTHTLTLYYLAQIIGSLGDLHKSAVYCHNTLKRQLQFNDYEPIDWALNAATMSQYFFTNNRNIESIHHLAAASYMLHKHELQMYTPNMTEDEKGAILETFNHRSADIMRCWAKYGLNLLIESKNRLLTDGDDQDIGNLTKEVEKLELVDKNQCVFHNIDLTPYENCITDQYCLIYDDAKLVFLSIQNWLNEAKTYYTADSEASEYAKIIQDISSAYKYLAFFDFDEGNQCKLHKRRADLLDDLLNMLNPTYYLAICRELWYELGMTYSTILDIKLEAFEKIKISENPTPHVVNKINKLCNKSIVHFQSFINSYVEKDSSELPKSLLNDELTIILFAHFQIARLYYKIITHDKLMQILNIQNSLKYYNLFVKACNENKTICEQMKAEYGVCKEMTELLPLKINKLRAEANTNE